MTSPIIREMRQDDLSAIGELHASSWSRSYSNVIPQDRLDGEIAQSLKERWLGCQPDESDTVLVAVPRSDDTEILGFGAIWCRPKPCLDNLHVAPSARGQGIGQALLQAAARHLQNSGHHSLFLTVFRDNIKARAFYRRLGGIEQKAQDLEVFGVRIPSVEVHWPDLGKISSAEPR